MLEFVSVSGRLSVLENYHRPHRLEGVVQSYSHKMGMLLSPSLSKRYLTTASLVFIDRVKPRVRCDSGRET
jgi:hypothetical protein